jgi:hypothetical protein
MRFLVHGAIGAEAKAALARHEQACHEAAELAGEDAAAAAAGTPGELAKLLARRQWNLLTTDTALVARWYEEKAAFAGVIVVILETATAKGGQADAVERLFERYPRLTARRMYTVTASRVKIRQLPGANAGGGAK